jgi:ABC-type multidrug transport system fused ATPase/permease subunit
MTDRVLLIDEGRLIQDAPHTQLLQENEYYQAMYEKQVILSGVQ